MYLACTDPAYLGNCTTGAPHDVCYDAVFIPEPFNDTGFFFMSLLPAYNVLYSLFPSCNILVVIPTSIEDELGVNGGIKSGTNMSFVKPLTGMPNILINGLPACNWGITQSINNAGNTFGLYAVPCQFLVLGF